MVSSLYAGDGPSPLLLVLLMTGLLGAFCRTFGIPEGGQEVNYIDRQVQCMEIARSSL